MTVSVECPKCGKSYNVRDESIGARANCKSCGATFTLSISMDDTGKSSSKDADSDKAPAKKAEARSSHAKSSAGKAEAQRSSAGQSKKPVPEKVPKKLGNYVVQRKLGAGAMGVVYLGRDPVLDRKVAIKVLPASLSSDEERLKRFLREAKSAARLIHTNVAAVHQAGAEGRLAYIAMEYVEGMSLDQVVSEGKPMDWKEATRIIRDAAAGLGAAHAIELVHRDIKPGNLMRTKDGVTKVVDFGLARGQQTDTQLTQQGTLLGTPAYMAPEQWMGGEVDGRTDLYSLTCTYYYLLTGQLPFDAPSMPALGYQHRYEAFPDPREHVAGLPDGVCRALVQGSAKKPEERFQNAEELVSALDVLLACPEESLTFGSSWQEMGAATDAEPSAAVDPLPNGFPKIEASAAALPQSQPSVAVRSKLEIPVWVWAAVGGGIVALLLLLGVVFIFSSKHGTVQITLHNADDNVKISLDGDTISIDGLKELLKLKVGEHNLVASSPNFETVTQSFRVKEGETTVVEVTFVPKAAPDTVAEGAASPATYRVTLDPPQATLAASGEGASVTGQGGERIVRVAEADGQSKVTLVAMLDGYQDHRQELQPVAGETRHLIVRLEPVPKPSPKPQVSESPKKKTTIATKSGQTQAMTPSVPSPDETPDVGEPRGGGKPTEVSGDSSLGKTMTNSIGMKLVLIPQGEFMMGSQESQEQLSKAFPTHVPKWVDFRDEQPPHRVRITRAFYLGAHEVTVGQFRQFAEEANYRTEAERDGQGGTGDEESGHAEVRRKPKCTWRHTGWNQSDDHPVVNVTWNDAVAFCEWLSGKEDKTYRLPTEAEWEYACRANTTTRWYHGDDIEGLAHVANVVDATAKAKWSAKYERDNRTTLHPLRASDGHAFTAPVGSFQPNTFGLYDMHGNVWEWCADWYSEDYYGTSPTDDPTGPPNGVLRVARNADWTANPLGSRSANRNGLAPDYRSGSSGFRVVMTMPDTTPAAKPTVDGSSAHKMPPLPKGCVVAYSFDRDTIFSQGSKQYVRDLSGNDYHGLLSNVTITDGSVGAAAEFNRTRRSHVTLPKEDGQYPAGDFTMVAWLSNVSGSILDLNCSVSGVPNHCGGALLWASGGQMRVYISCPDGRHGNDNSIMSSPDVLGREQWTHCAFRRQGGTIAFFANGNLDQVRPCPGGKIVYQYQAYDDNSVHIGLWRRKGWDDDSGYWGRIDEFVLFDRALSDNEIADLYRRQSGG